MPISACPGRRGRTPSHSGLTVPCSEGIHWKSSGSKTRLRENPGYLKIPGSRTATLSFGRDSKAGYSRFQSTPWKINRLSAACSMTRMRERERERGRNSLHISVKGKSVQRLTVQGSVLAQVSGAVRRLLPGAGSPREEEPEIGSLEQSLGFATLGATGPSCAKARSRRSKVLGSVSSSRGWRHRGLPLEPCSPLGFYRGCQTLPLRIQCCFWTLILQLDRRCSEEQVAGLRDF
ncbi:uncharacterized protein LOC134057132 isoform X2 [Cinclus cinclus]|uniref:uncharacterized protein LOC134057120 isoform X2 n=1 Tax=Cinclus cinclus TaxID=127875 RepID=UPI002E14F1C9